MGAAKSPPADSKSACKQLTVYDKGLEVGTDLVLAVTGTQASEPKPGHQAVGEDHLDGDSIRW